VHGNERSALMLRHIALIVSLTLVALAAGYAMVPGEREQWTMLVRDGRNQEALKALESRYRAGKREVDAVLHLYKLYMSFADIDAATRIMEDFVHDHPNDPQVVSLLAKHYGDIQNKPAEVRALERLFKLAPSQPTARDLLAYYRLEGAFDREESLLRTLLADQMITANDAERLGLILAAHGDFYGARDALTRFDEIANPERSVGRLVLFDVLVQIGDKTTALSKAASWIGYWRKASIHRTASAELPSTRLIRMMIAVDEEAARKLICDVQRNETPDGACELRVLPDAEAAPDAEAVTSVELRNETGRRRRR
jgi:tetratricopeptide (TPR) repeat protein